MFEGLFALLCVLLSLAFVVAIVTVVGHGFWVLFAAIFGSKQVSRHPHEERGDPRKVACADCGVRFPRRAGRCPFCGLEINDGRETELDDLEAAARTIQRLKEVGKLEAHHCEQIYRAIEARQDELVERRPRFVDEEERPIGPIAQLEAWFGNDFGAALSVGEKKRALALIRTLEVDTLRELPAPALVGVARLQTSVGMLSRACGVYRMLLECHPDAPVIGQAATDALEIACKLRDWPLAQELAHVVAGIPGLIEKHADLAALVEQVRTDTMWHDAPRREQHDAERRATMGDALPVVVPVAELVVQAPIVAEVVQPSPAAALPEREARNASAPIEPVVVETALPRRSFAEWIAVFMEEKNILWGELIGGTLIIGCSIALVISLWSKLAEIEFFPFLILAAITSAVLAAGFYTLHHWKLESTSRGLLLIGMLLVPLDFAVLAGLPHEAGAWWLHYAFGVSAFALFGWMVLRASVILIQTPLDAPSPPTPLPEGEGRIATAPSALLTTIAMLVSAAALMISPMTQGLPSLEFLASLTSVLALVVVLGWILLCLNRVEPWTLPRLAGLMVALGCTTFACGVALGFPIFNSQDTTATLLQLSPALTLFGVPMLLAGTLIPIKLAADEGESAGIWRTVGTGLALAGVFVMFGGFVVSMEEVTHRWLCGLLNAGTLLAVAWMLRAPLLHILAQLYLGVLVVVGGTLQIDALIASRDAGLRMAGLMIVQALAAEGWMRLERRRDALCYAIGGGVSAGLAALLILPRAQEEPWAAALVLGAAALTWLVANLRWRFGEITYACSIVLAAAIFFTFRQFDAEAPFAAQLLWSLLTLASVCLIAATALRFATVDWLRDVYRIPLQFASLGATALIAGVVAVEQVHGTLSWSISSIACAWLAAIWLTIAVFEGWALLFGAFQVALCFAWLFGAGGRLQTLHWHWQEPYSLHVYGVGLAALCLISEIVRKTLRSQPRADALLNPPFVPFDRVIASSLLIGQYMLAGIVVLRSAGHELLPTPELWRLLPEAWYANAYSIWPWLLLALLAGVMVTWLRSQQAAALIGLAVLALTLPLVAAGGWFDATISAASAVRWGLTLVFACGSFLVWFRHRLGEERAANVPAMALRGIFIAGAVCPALAFTLIVVVRKLSGGQFAGPLEGGIFRAMGGPASLLIPMAFLSATLAGHGFRERLAYYLSAAGWLANLSCVGGFFLTLPREDFGEPWVVVDALLIAAGAAWCWAIAWTWIASLLEQGESRPLLGSWLLSLHSVIAALLFGTVLTPALFAIIAKNPAGLQWIQATGSIWSWLVVMAMAFAACYLSWTRRASIPLYLVGALSLTAFAVTACSFEIIHEGKSFVALMFLSGVFASGWVCVNLFLDPITAPPWLTRTRGRFEEVVYACISGAAAVLLGAATLITTEDEIWSANSILLAAAAMALLAYRRKAEIWSTLATLATILASIILVIHFDPVDEYLGLRLLQVSLAILGAAAIVRLAAHRFIVRDGVEVQHLILLPAQIMLGMTVALVLAAVGLAELAIAPATPDKLLQRVGDVSGWLALATNLAAAIWYLGVVRPRWVVHGVALGALMVGVAAAGSATAIFPATAWLGHHVLTLCWTLAGLGLLIVSWTSHVQPALGPQFWPSERRVWLADWLRRSFPESWARLWVTACGAFVVLLALRAISVEPERPYWSVGNTTAVILLLTTLAIWARAPIYLYGAGLLFNVIGLLLFTSWSSHRLNAPGALLPNDEWVSIGVLAQILSFAAASIVCSLLERSLLKRGIDFTGSIGLPYAQAALVAGIHLLAIGVGLANGLHLTGEGVRLATGMAWIALGVLALASGVELWRPGFHRFTRYHLYTCGLIAIGLLLHGLALPIPRWYLTATLLLAGYVLVVVIVTRIALAWRWLSELLHLPATPDAGGRWFWNAQLLAIALVVGMSMWITLTFDTQLERLSGALACALASVATLLLAPVWRRLYAIADESSDAGTIRLPIYLFHTLVVAFALELCWAIIDPALDAVWLQRIAAALVLVIATTMAHRLLLPRLMRDSVWLEPSRMFSAIGGVLSIALIVVLLGYELKSYDAAPDVRTTPLVLEWKIIVAAAVLGLAGLALWSALTKELDVYGIENAKRSFYVYLTELLIVALFVHVRLNVPRVPQFLGQYWYLALMALAFGGVALSEWLAHKKLPVLAVPIQRSMILLAIVPVLAFQFAHVAPIFEPMKATIPGIEPFLNYLRTLRAQRLWQFDVVPMESLCWLLLAIFISWQARLRQSANLAIFAALALNFGVWVLLGDRAATKFLERPQLWLIPLGLIILVAEFVNRRRLGFWPSLAARYIGLLCIYLSSTMEMFMAGLGTSVIFPIVLALLAIAGIMLGILFRVRAFLLAGFMALFVDIFAQIWYAAVGLGNTWIWWVCGIGLGVVILALFAVFEKRRNEMLKMLDDMKRWH